MNSLPGIDESMDASQVELAAPTLLTELEPRGQAFRESFAAVFRTPEPISDAGPPGNFWPDVFVNRRLPWSPFMQSAAFHSGAIALIWVLSIAWMRQHPLSARPKFDPSSVTYFSPEEYLRPLDTGEGRLQPQKGEPEFARQAIISVPREPDNQTQTIVVPPDIKLAQQVRLPNVVSWPQTTLSVPITASSPGAKLPMLPVAVVAPPPDVDPSTGHRPMADLGQNIVGPAPDAGTVTSDRNIRAPQAAVIEPAPNVEPTSARKYGDINIAHAEVVAPAPQLSLSEQQAGSGRMQRALGETSTSVVPPPPSVSGSGGTNTGSRLIALGVNPAAPTGPVEPPAGNRRGSFSANPSGKPGAAGTPDVPGTADGKNASLGSQSGAGSSAGGAKSASNGLPAGLHVGPAPPGAPIGNIASEGSAGKSSDGVSSVIASTNPRTNTTPSGKMASPLPDEKVSDLDRQVFGPRRVYSMTLNMPNLNSSGGSWVIRFSELKEESAKGELFAPEATHKVDPGYPIELIRQNVQGMVTLRAVIHSDGRVSDVKVLNSPDERLDTYARAAFEQWQFRPGMKNGNAVALEAVVTIPFRIRKAF